MPLQRPAHTTAALLLACAAPISALPGSAESQPEAAADAQLDPAAVVKGVREVIAARYVLPDKRPALDAVLAEGLASGRYAVSEPTALARLVNEDLARVGQDEHLGFTYDPRLAAMMGRRDEAGAFDPSEYERAVRQRNHGITELRVMPGNVRYMNFTGFDFIGEESQAALADAMRFLRGGEAVIIDLRGNGGGSPDAVQYIASHFMEAGRPLVTFYMDGEPDPVGLATLQDLGEARMVGMPLYVLVSGRTASAAEEFTGHVGGYDLGELVGENTAGAGFRNDHAVIGDGFVLSVSVGRAVLASTGKDWEAVGLAPTLPTRAEDALQVAHAAALERVAQGRDPAQRAPLVALADAIRAQTEQRLPAAGLQAYAGLFGERSITLEDGVLHYQLEGRPRERLVPLGGDAFVFASAPETRVEFVIAEDRAGALQVGSVGGDVQGVYPRTG